MPVPRLGSAPRAVYALTGVAREPGQGIAGIAVIIKDTHKQTLKQISRRIHTTSPEAPKYEAVCIALREALELGARSVSIYVDDPVVVGHLRQDLQVPPELTGPYLEIRALLHRFRQADIRFLEEGRNRRARLLAELAVRERAGHARSYVPLPLPLTFGA